MTAPPMATDTNTTAAPRLTSVDAFRGLTVLAMIFVNQLANYGELGVPAWLMHVPPDQTGITFVDVIFPAFLFIVGLAIPFALEKRFAAGAALRDVLSHVMGRTFALLLIGFFMVNMYVASPEGMLLPRPLWNLLAFLGLLGLFCHYRCSCTGEVARGAAVMLLVTLAVFYRNRDGGWMAPMWWGIIGLIGWAYAVAALGYVAWRGNVASHFKLLGVLSVLYAAHRMGALDWARFITSWLDVGGHIGSHGALSVAGVIVGCWLRQLAGQHRALLVRMVAFAAMLLAAGYLTNLVHPFHKSNATESWALASAGWSLLAFAALYSLMDVARIYRWSAIILPLGTNALLAYMLPDMVNYALEVVGARGVLSLPTGTASAIVFTVVYTGVMVALAHGLTRGGVVLRV